MMYKKPPTVQDGVEVTVFQEGETKELIDNPIYECMSPLRCLLIKHVNPNNWNVLQKMEKHTEVGNIFHFNK